MLCLRMKNHKIACEIAVTNTTEYEVMNIQKCLSSGFDRMVVISADTRHLQNIRKRAELVLSPIHLSKVYFLEPENFHLFPESLPSKRSSDEPEPQKVIGYTIKPEVKESSPPKPLRRKPLLSILNHDRANCHRHLCSKTNTASAARSRCRDESTNRKGHRPIHCRLFGRCSEDPVFRRSCKRFAYSERGSECYGGDQLSDTTSR